MIDRLLGKKVIGIKQVTKAIENGQGKILYVQKMLMKRLVNDLVELAKENNVEVNIC